MSKTYTKMSADTENFITPLAKKRLMGELRLLLKEPMEYIDTYPDENDMLIWYFCIKGPVDTDYYGGYTIGMLLHSPKYPNAPPDYKLLTPNGRFETGRKICMTNTGYHAEQWSAVWNIKTLLNAFLSIMTSDDTTGLGHITVSPTTKTRNSDLERLKKERHELAKKSVEYNLLNHFDIWTKFSRFVEPDGSLKVKTDDTHNPNLLMNAKLLNIKKTDANNDSNAGNNNDNNNNNNNNNNGSTNNTDNPVVHNNAENTLNNNNNDDTKVHTPIAQNDNANNNANDTDTNNTVINNTDINNTVINNTIIIQNDNKDDDKDNIVVKKKTPKKKAVTTDNIDGTNNNNGTDNNNNNNVNIIGKSESNTDEPAKVEPAKKRVYKKKVATNAIDTNTIGTNNPANTINTINTNNTVEAIENKTENKTEEPVKKRVYKKKVAVDAVNVDAVNAVNVGAVGTANINTNTPENKTEEPVKKRTYKKKVPVDETVPTK